MEKDAFFKIFVNICFVIGFNITGNISFSIFKYIKNRSSRVKNCTTSSYILMCITNPFTVINKNTRRVAVIVKVGVHTANDVVSKGILVIFCHFGKFFMGPVCLILKILINLVISGNDGNVGVGRVNLDNMKHLSSGTCCIVKYHFRLNSSTRNKNIIFFGNYIIVTVSAK